MRCCAITAENGSNHDGDNGYIIITDTESEYVQLRVFMDALAVYAERNEMYKDNWRRMGWRGCLVRIRERAERLWDNFWDQEAVDEIERAMYRPRDTDDAIDLINFAAFMVRAVRGETTRDGSWW